MPPLFASRVERRGFLSGGMPTFPTSNYSRAILKVQ